MSIATRAIESSIGTIPSDILLIPFLSPMASRKASPNTIPTSSTV